MANNKKKYWGLVKGVVDKRQQWQLDQDYIKSLEHQSNDPDEVKAAIAKQAREFLTAFMSAELDGDFRLLADLGITPTKEYKSQVYNSRYTAQNDFISSNQGAQVELSEFQDPDTASTIGELHAAIKQQKKNRRVIKRKNKVSKI